MITVIDGDMFARRWDKHQNTAEQLSILLLEHLYKLRSFPQPFQPPDAMTIAFTDGTWREHPYHINPIDLDFRDYLINLFEGFDIPVLVGPCTESVDWLASVSQSEASILVSNDIRLAPVMSESCEIFRPVHGEYGASWEMWTAEQWRRQYGKTACANWPAFLDLIGVPEHGIPRTLGPRQAIRKCHDHSCHYMDVALYDVTVPRITAKARATLLKTDIEGISAAMAKHEADMFKRTLRQLKHEVDPSQPTEYRPGTVERTVVAYLRAEKDLPLNVEGDYVLPTGAPGQRPGECKNHNRE